jgi:hypothetical protein
VAVQIRRGDKVHWDNSGCGKEDFYMYEPRCRQDFSASFAEYMAVVKRELDGPLMAGSGARTVYVMSDDPGFVAKGAAEFPGYKIMLLSGWVRASVLLAVRGWRERGWERAGGSGVRAAAFHSGWCSLG